MQQEQSLPHKLTLSERNKLILTGVTEVVSFDENAVILQTSLGQLTVHGQNLQLKMLSPEGGEAAVEGRVTAFVYEEPRHSGGFLRRLFG